MNTVEIRMPDDYFIRRFVSIISPYTYGDGINSPEIGEQVLANLLGWA
jgi:hypothetical protein